MQNIAENHAATWCQELAADFSSFMSHIDCLAVNVQLVGAAIILAVKADTAIRKLRTNFFYITLAPDHNSDLKTDHISNINILPPVSAPPVLSKFYGTKAK